MPDATFLHIQTRERSVASRVLELSGVSIRIGRGPQCEVRLEDDLAEVQCLLRRRGRTWHIQPVGPSGVLSLEGRSVECQQIWHFGVPLRVGQHWLTLQSESADSSGLGSFSHPIETSRLPVPTADGVKPTPFSPRPLPAREQPKPIPPAGSSPLHHPAWSDPIGSYERVLRPRDLAGASRPRWRVLGSQIRSQLNPAPVASPVPPSSDVTHRTGQIPPWERPDSSPGPIEPPPRSEPRSLRLPSISDARHFRRRFRSRPNTGGTSGRLNSFPAAAAPVESRDREAVPTTNGAEESLPSLGPESCDGPTHGPVNRCREEGLTFLGSDPSTTAFSQSVLDPLARDDVETEPPSPANDISAPEALEERLSERAIDPSPGSGPSSQTAREDPTRSLTGVRESFPSRTDSHPSTRVDPATWLTAEPFVAHTAQGQLWEAARWSVTSESSTTRRDDELEWPSIHEILSQHMSAPDTATRRATAKPCRVPVPTQACPPARWTLSGWLIGLPALAATLLIGGLALGLSWIQAQNDQIASQLANHLLGGETLPLKPMVVPETTGTTWWQTRSGSLLMRAIVLSRRNESGEHDEEIHSLLESARRISPLDPAVHLALAGPGFPSLGLSRDVIALRISGQQWLKEGKTKAALRVYRKALTLLAEADPLRAPPPPYFATPGTTRFGMPYEDMIDILLSDLINDGSEGLRFEEWSQALPPSPVVALAAYRLCLEKNRLELDQVFALVESICTRARPGVETVAWAEALALRGRLEEAEQLYRASLGSIPAGLVQRSWWLNLAEIEGRLGRDEEMREAWEAARGSDPRDPINRRLVESRQRHGVGGPPLAQSNSGAPSKPIRDEGLLRTNGRRPE